MAWNSFEPAQALNVVPRGDGTHALLDPYWVWAERSAWKGFAETDQASFIAQLANGKTVADLRAEAGAVNLPLWLPPIYGKPGRPESESPYLTGSVPRSQLHLLANLRCLQRWELGTAVKPAIAAGAGPSFDEVKPRKAPKAGPPATALIGVIDDGLAALNGMFRYDNTASRVRLLWDQGEAAAGAPWMTPLDFAYGRELMPGALDGELAQRAAEFDAQKRVDDESSVYRRWDYLRPPDRPVAPRPPWFATHGTHVANVAAGNHDPLLPRGAAPDLAAGCELAFVGLPYSTVADSSGGALPVHLLDGLRAIFAQCADDATVVVNISYGCQGGPHDGSSLLEQAVDDLLDRRGERSAIVLSAGNSANAAAHAQAQVSSAAAMELQWDVPADDITDSFVEIWYPPSAGADLRVEVTSAETGLSTGPLAAGESAELVDGDAEVIAVLVHQARVPNGRDAMALLALAPTKAGTVARQTVPAGRWSIKVSVAAGFAGVVPVHAYVERDDPVPVSGKPPSRFVAGSTAEGTLNGLATGHRTWVAGGCMQSSGQRVPYSSLGPTRDGRTDAPHRLAACERDEALRHVRAAAVRSADTLAMNGTSVAAPVLARRLMNHLLDGGTGLPPELVLR